MKQTLIYIGLVIVFIGLGIGSKTIYIMYQQGKFDDKSVVQKEEASSQIDYTVSNQAFYDSLETLSKVTVNIPESKETTRIEEKVAEKKIETSANKEQNVERNGALYKKPFYIISISAVSKKESAVKGALKIQKKKQKGNFLWIPDYFPQGKKLYKVYIGPFNSKELAIQQKELIATQYPGCYVQSIK